MERILVIGDACNEWLLHTQGLDEDEGITACDRTRRVPGGRGLSAAVAGKKLGMDCILSTRVGRDGGGSGILRYLNTEKMDCRFINVTPGVDTETRFLIAEGSETAKFIRRGAYALLSEEDISDSFMCYPDDVMLFAGSRTFAVETVFRQATAQEIPIFLMSASSLPKNPEKGYRCEIFSVTAEEAVKLTGISPVSKEKCFRACVEMERLIQAKAYVIRLGDRGCFWYDGTYFDFALAYDVPETEETSALDGIVSAAIVFRYLKYSEHIRKCCEYAAVAAAYYRIHGGGVGAYPTENDIKVFMEERELEYHDDGT